ncbi:MAG: hypothetical protein IKS80_03275, partial [Bacteroidaceae bacterium]|nr:hypothetical protein [Bacteroidaceae bacterium]
LVVMSVAFAVLYAVSELLTEYRWVKIIPMLGFLYMTLLLAFTDTAREIVRPRWVQIIVVVFCVTYFLILLWLLISGRSRNAIRIIELLTQPVTVWLFIQFGQKKRRCRKAGG